MFKYLAIFMVGVAGYKGYTEYYPVWRTDRAVMQAVERENAQLPRVINNVIRMESFSYKNKTVYAVGTVLDAVPINDDYKPLIGAKLQDVYCKGTWRMLAESKVSFEYTIKFESPAYRGIEWVYSESPAVCGIS
jgi:hypothetical protein